MVWVLRLLPAQGEPGVALDRRVAGLSCSLRLALSAQAAGADSIVLAPEAEVCRPLLQDGRLKISVRAEPNEEPAPKLAIEAPANLVVHRDLFGMIISSKPEGTVRLPDEAQHLDKPFAFDPILVVDRASGARAEKALLRALRKIQDGWTSTYLNRYISLFLTRWLVRTPLRPNQLSVVILAVGFFGAWLASHGTYWYLLAGAFLFQAQSVLDGCDGEMSRVTWRGSHLGEWLDTAGDDLTNYAFFGGAAWGLYMTTDWWGYLVAGALTVGCGFLTSAIEYRYLIKIGSGDLLKYPLGLGKAPGGSARRKRGLARVADAIAPLFKRDTFVFMTFLGAAAGLLGPFLILFALAGVGILTAVLQNETRMARERTGI